MFLTLKNEAKKGDAIIDEAIENYPVNKENVTLLGFSQGTILSYAVALSYPNKISNIIGIFA